MYTNYAYGVENQTGTASGTYNLFVTGNADYTGASGFMIKNDIMTVHAQSHVNSF